MDRCLWAAHQETFPDDISATCTIVVPKLSIGYNGTDYTNGQNITLEDNNNITLSASLIPIVDYTNINWSSDNPNYVSFDETNASSPSPKPTIGDPGTANITVTITLEDGSTISTTCKIIVPIPTPSINGITINNTDFVAGRAYIITISGSGFGSSRTASGIIPGHVSFTNSDWGGGVVPIKDNNDGTSTTLIDDNDDCDYDSWGDKEIQIYLPSEIKHNNFSKYYGSSIAIGTGFVTITNAWNNVSQTYSITIPHSFKTHYDDDNAIKYPTSLQAGNLTFSYGTGSD